MPRGPSNAFGGLIYHVLNRGVGRQTLFHKPADFEAFERIMVEALDEVPMRILSVQSRSRLAGNPLAMARW
jgi:putative transposase